MEQKKKTHKLRKTIVVIVALLLFFIFAFFGITRNLAKENVQGFERIDEAGTLYYCDYQGAYDKKILQVIPQALTKFACSAFITDNENGDKITCRNFDYDHVDASGNPTAINVVLKCEPNNGYKSINMVDVALFSDIGISFEQGKLEEVELPQFPLVYLPYFCMDGMNEKGLTCSILQLDTKEGETPPNQTEKDKPTYSILEMLRYTLDNCATVEEAEEFIQSANYSSVLGTSYHMFISDANGKSTVAEWRNNEFTSTHNDAVTNFYTNSDDATDVYLPNGKLKEKYVEPVSKYRDYRYGYGHGYNRFSTIIQSLDNHRTNATEATKMTNDQAMNTLQSVSQVYDEEDQTSNTLYSVMYNNTNLTMKIATFRNYDNLYSFSLLD